MTPSIVVHHPIPEALRHLLAAAGYLETGTTGRCSIFSAQEPKRTSSRPGAGVSPVAPRMEKLLFTPVEAAEYLSIGRTKVYELITTGSLASVRVGKCRRIPASALVDFASHLQAGVPEGVGGPGRK